MKEERARRAGRLAADLHDGYLRGCVGRVFDVLYEQEEDGQCRGHAPNYMTVVVPGRNLRNRVLPTRVTGAADGVLTGELSAPLS